MKQVKPSERLPEEPGEYYAEFTGFHTLKRVVEFRSNDTFYNLHQNVPLEVNWWLDEEDEPSNETDLTKFQIKYANLQVEFIEYQQKYSRFLSALNLKLLPLIFDSGKLLEVYVGCLELLNNKQE